MSSVTFITEVGLNDTYATGVVLERIALSIPDDWSVNVIIIGNPELHYFHSSRLRKMNTVWIERPEERRLGNAIADIVLDALFIAEIIEIKRKIQNFSFFKESNIVIASLESSSLIYLASKMNFSDKKLVSLMWDDFNWFAEDHSLSQKRKKKFLSLQEFAIKRSQVVFFPSDSMKELFEQRRSTFSTFRTLYPLLVAGDYQRTTSTSGKFRIGFAGKHYAKNEIDFFTENIKKFNEFNENCVIEFYSFSREVLTYNDENIKSLGFLTIDELAMELANCDAFLLPYPFDENFRKIVTTSFPSKLANYAAAEKPIFYIGPPDAAVAKMLKEFNFYCLLFTLEEEKVFQLLSKLVKRADFYSHEADRTVLLRKTYFSEEAFNTNMQLIDNSFSFQIRNSRYSTESKLEKKTLRLSHKLYKFFHKALLSNLLAYKSDFRLKE